MKILVIGGTHGNEPLGPKIVDKLKTSPVKNIDGLIANEIAYSAHTRFIEQDLNRAFPGVKNSSEYEHRRPFELLKIAKKYDVVLDFHNTHCPDNDCGFIGETANSNLLGVAEALGLKRVVVANYDCVNKYAPNCLSVEVSLNSKQNDASLWIDRISLLLEKLNKKELPSGKSVELFTFVYRMTLDDRDRLKLNPKNLKAFQEIDLGITRQLGVKSPAYPIFVNDAYTPYNFGGIINKLK